MNPIKRGRVTRLALAAFGAVGVLAIFAGVAGAFTGTATITGGTISLVGAPTSLDFGNTTLDGTIKYVASTDGAESFSVKDATGSGKGWILSSTATTFTCDHTAIPATDCTTTHTLGALEVNGSSNHSTNAAPSINCTAGTECNALGSSTVLAASFPISIDSSGENLITQPSGDGMGIVDVSNFYWFLTIPLSAYAGTYQSTITLDINSGP